MGLVSKVLPVDELRAFAQGQAAKLVALPAASIRATKGLMKRAKAASIMDAMAAENTLFGAMLQAPEAKEAFTAFFEKRKPDFSKDSIFISNGCAVPVPPFQPLASMALLIFH